MSKRRVEFGFEAAQQSTLSPLTIKPLHYTDSGHQGWEQSITGPEVGLGIGTWINGLIRGKQISGNHTQKTGCRPLTLDCVLSPTLADTYIMQTLTRYMIIKSVILQFVHTKKNISL